VLYFGNCHTSLQPMNPPRLPCLTSIKMQKIRHVEQKLKVAAVTILCKHFISGCRTEVKAVDSHLGHPDSIHG